MTTRFASTAPGHFRKVVVKELSRDFAKATEVRVVSMPTMIKPTEVIVRNLYAGVNASDINYTAGVYRPNLKPPFDCGFEGLGEVVAVGSGVSNFDLNDHVVTQSFGTFSEYQIVASRNVRKVPRADPRYIALEVSGVTASVCLDQVLQPQPKEVALVTAAAGGTGQFAVQLLKKKYGCHVIGTCSSQAKAEYLRRIGCDRVINYRVEQLDEVLTAEYKSGVNVVYESVGGDMFDVAVKHLAVKGRLGVIGNITGYRNGASFGEQPSSNNSAAAVAASTERAGYRPGSPIGSTLLWKSASVRGFFLPHFAKHVSQHFDLLQDMVDTGAIESTVDPAMFRGVESVANAVEHLLGGTSCGKVIVHVPTVRM